MAALAAAAVGPLRRRAGLLLQLGRGGGRGGAQVRAQGDRQARDRRARGLVPRPHARRARRDRPAGEARGVRAARAGRHVRARERRRRRSRRRSGRRRGCILLEPIQGEGGVHPLDAGVRRRRARARRRARRAARLRRGADRRRPHRARSSPGEQLGVRPDAVTLAKGLANGLPIGCLLVADDAAGAFEPGRPRRAPSAATPSPAPRPAPSATTIDDELLADVRAQGRVACRGAAERCAAVVEVRGAGLLLGAELDRPAARRRRRVPRARPARRLGGRADAAPHAAADDHRRRGRPGARDPRGGARVSTSSSGRARSCASSRSSELSTQAELAEALREQGFDAVQTTVSRDIAQLGLVKVRERGRQARLRAARRRRPRPAERADGGAPALGARARRRAATSSSSTTPPGYANALARAIDARAACPTSPARSPATTRSSSPPARASGRRARRRAAPPPGRRHMTRNRRARLLGRARHELRDRVAEGGLRLRRGRRRARRRRPGRGLRAGVRARHARQAPTTSSCSTARTSSPTSRWRRRCSRTRSTRASTRSSRRSRGP